MNVAWGSPLHDKVLTAVRKRWYFSRNKISERYTVWNKAEDQFQAFIPEREADAKRRTQRESGMPQYTTIEIPYSYAQLLAAHTYWTSVFLARNPVFQFEGRHGETEDSIQAVEAIIDYQVSVGAMLVPLYIWLMDVGKYGMGLVGTYWEEEKANVTRIIEVPKQFLGMPIPGSSRKVRQTQTVDGYKGNKLYNIRPYDWFPDPRVPVSQFQRGEFCSRYVEVGWNHMLRKKADGVYYNLDEAMKTKPVGWMRDRGSPRLNIPNQDNAVSPQGEGSPSADMDINKLDYVELLEMHIELVPEVWSLGTSKVPEKWVFTVANDAVVVSAQPLGLLHNQFPFNLMEYEVEGYGLFKRGMSEMVKPLNDVMTWLFNSHFYNVRKVMNDQFVVDPSRIVMKDATDPAPGKMIRLKPSAYGTDPRLALAQLQVVDVTQNHIRDISVVADMIQRMTGVNDQIMGMINTGGRKSATEVRTSSTFGVNRLKTNSEYFSAQGWAPLSQMMLQNTQQFMQQQQSFRIAGELLGRAQSFLSIKPEDIMGFYDFVPVDGTMPVDRYAQAALWKDLLAGMRQFPQLMMQYDIPAIFSYAAQLAGVRNVDRFRIQVTPDQELQSRMLAGNVIPLRGAKGGQAAGGPPGAIPSGTEGNPLAATGPTQVAGMGPAG
jgi:hypothetical protein